MHDTRGVSLISLLSRRAFSPRISVLDEAMVQPARELVPVPIFHANSGQSEEVNRTLNGEGLGRAGRLVACLLEERHGLVAVLSVRVREMLQRPPEQLLEAALVLDNLRRWASRSRRGRDECVTECPPISIPGPEASCLTSWDDRGRDAGADAIGARAGPVLDGVEQLFPSRAGQPMKNLPQLVVGEVPL